MVLCVGERSQIQALERTPVLPLLPGTRQWASHDYLRYGTTNLYAALDVWPSGRTSDLAQDHLGPASVAAHELSMCRVRRTKRYPRVGGPRVDLAARPRNRHQRSTRVAITDIGGVCRYAG